MRSHLEVEKELAALRALLLVFENCPALQWSPIGEERVVAVAAQIRALQESMGSFDLGVAFPDDSDETDGITAYEHARRAVTWRVAEALDEIAPPSKYWFLEIEEAAQGDEGGDDD